MSSTFEAGSRHCKSVTLGSLTAVGSKRQQTNAVRSIELVTRQLIGDWTSYNNRRAFVTTDRQSYDCRQCAVVKWSRTSARISLISIDVTQDRCAWKSSASSQRISAADAHSVNQRHYLALYGGPQRRPIMHCTSPVCLYVCLSVFPLPAVSQG